MGLDGEVGLRVLAEAISWVLISFSCMSSEDLLGAENRVRWCGFLFFRLGDLIERTATLLESEIQHSDGGLEVERPWDTDQVGSKGQLVDGNQWDDFTGGADKEISRRWFTFSSGVSRGIWHI
jgi:hypothetical protein